MNRTKPSANAGFAWDDTKTYTVPDAAGTCCLLSDCVFWHCMLRWCGSWFAVFVAFKALHSVANILNFFEKFINFYEMMTVIIKLESFKYRHIFT